MVRRNQIYSCQACGSISARWVGKCEACGEWNTLQEEQTTFDTKPQGRRSLATRDQRKGIVLEDLRATTRLPERILSGFKEVDRVLGGGFVPGSVILFGGNPGIGKSTLLLQISTKLADSAHQVVYISGEEAISQVKLRASRLGLADRDVKLASATHVEDILKTLSTTQGISFVIIDSIQTMWSDEVDSSAGTVSQVRVSAQKLIHLAKSKGIVVVLVGHVTKDGQIAGPRLVEHMVDVVASFEMSQSHLFRILRCLKNRYGPTDEIGVFEMTGAGVQEVFDPSMLFLSNRESHVPGVSVLAGLEGTRPFLTEIQALVVPTTLTIPRRTVIGWDHNRLSMLLAVLEAYGGTRLNQHDVYLNVSGGLKIAEPAADLAIAAALLSSYTRRILPLKRAYFGEIGLSGAIRGVPQEMLRIKEAIKLGFTEMSLPYDKSKDFRRIDTIQTLPMAHIRDLITDCKHMEHYVKFPNHEQGAVV